MDILQIFRLHILRDTATFTSLLISLQNNKSEESTSAIPGMSRAIIACSSVSASSGVSMVTL